jgi:Carboxypeptidase regulatory-like domain
MQPAAAVVMGTVTAGPLYPLTMPDRPNTRPVPGAVVEAVHDGNVVAAAATDDAGRYELSLDPGTYLIRARAEGSLHSKERGRTVTVSPGETVSVQFFLDTGIRCRSHQPATCPLGPRCRWATLV